MPTSIISNDIVFRYFTSWLETAVQAQSSAADSSSSTVSPCGRASTNPIASSRRGKSKSPRDPKSRNIDSEDEEDVEGVRREIERLSFGGWGGSQGGGGDGGGGSPDEDNDFFGASFR